MIRLIRDAGGIALIAHPGRKGLAHLDALMEMGLEGLEAFHFGMDKEVQAQALKLGLEKDLYISGGSDHEGYLGGSYDSYPSPEESPYYVPYCAIGTTQAFFNEIRDRKLNR